MSSKGVKAEMFFESYKAVLLCIIKFKVLTYSQRIVQYSVTQRSYRKIYVHIKYNVRTDSTVI